jgi:small subunit ribosomal protein S9
MAEKIIVASGKRKRAIARATLRKGKGSVRINKKPLSMFEPRIAREKIKEAITLAADHVKDLDIRVSVNGGGVMGQAEASRLAIARGLVEFTKDKKLEKTFLEYDRHLLVADVRRKEVRKPNTAGGARGKVQKSYR